MVVRPQVPISENLDGSFPPASQLLGKYAPEAEVVASLLDSLRLTDTTLHAIESDAVALVEAFRADPKLKTLLDAFLQEYGLSNNEGIALMCLAEALLRVPDAQTRDDLIADKLSSGDWSGHLGSDSGWLVNASTWGLMLTGRVTTLDPQWSDDGASALGRLTNRLGEPVIRVAVCARRNDQIRYFARSQSFPQRSALLFRYVGRGRAYLCRRRAPFYQLPKGYRSSRQDGRR